MPRDSEPHLIGTDQVCAAAPAESWSSGSSGVGPSCASKSSMAILAGHTHIAGDRSLAPEEWAQRWLASTNSTPVTDPATGRSAATGQVAHHPLRRHVKHAGLQRHHHLVRQLQNVSQALAVRVGSRVQHHMGGALGWLGDVVAVQLPTGDRPGACWPQGQPELGRLLASPNQLRRRPPPKHRARPRQQARARHPVPRRRR